MARHYQGSDEEWHPHLSTPSSKKTSPLAKHSKRPLEVLTLADDYDLEPKPKRKRTEKENESSQYSWEALPPSPPRTTTPSVAPASGAEVDSEESDSVYEQGEDENEEAFFTHPTTQTPRHRWLVTFFTYLVTPRQATTVIETDNNKVMSLQFQSYQFHGFDVKKKSRPALSSAFCFSLQHAVQVKKILELQPSGSDA